VRNSEKVDQIAIALNKSQAVMESAKKNSDNPFFHSKYADLAEVWDTCRKPLTDNGLSMVQTIGSVTSSEKTSPDDKGRTKPYIYLTVTSRLQHISEQFFEDSITMPVPADPQDMGKAATYLRRYGMMALIGIAPEDDDAESLTEHGKPASKPKQQASGDTPQKSGDSPATKDHWCEIHKTEFFKKGNMKTYAHPVMADGKPTGAWCNEKQPEPTPEQRTAMEVAVNKAAETVSNAPESTQDKQGGALPVKQAESTGQPLPQYKRDPESVKTTAMLVNSCNADFGLQPADVYKILEITRANDLTIRPPDAYKKVAAERGK
jgi:hypothetical protein